MPILFNIFINGQHHGTEHALGKPASDRKEWLMHHRVVLPVRGTLRGCRNGPTLWTHKVNAGMRKAPQPGSNNPLHQHRLRTNWLDSSPTEKDLRIPVDDRLPISHQCAFVAKQASSPLDRIRKSTVRRLRGVILPLCSPLVRRIWSIVSSSGLGSPRQTWAYCSKSSKGPQK